MCLCRCTFYISIYTSVYAKIPVEWADLESKEFNMRDFQQKLLRLKHKLAVNTDVTRV